jgi:ABC-type antimicrobial peptide transport system permease subunit
VLEALGVPRTRLAGLFAAEALALIAPPALAGLLVAGWLARKIDTGVTPASSAMLPLHSAMIGLLFVLALVVAITFIPCVRTMRTSVAANLSRD